MPFIRERCCSGDVLDDALWVDSAKVIWWPGGFRGSDWLLEWLCCNVFHVSLAFVADRITGGERGREDRLTDRIGLGVLTRLVHRDLVDEVLADTGRTERRRSLLPARVVVYFVLAMTLFFDDAYEEVMRKLVDGLRFLRSWDEDWQVPSASALCQARARNPDHTPTKLTALRSRHVPRWRIRSYRGHCCVRHRFARPQIAGDALSLRGDESALLSGIENRQGFGAPQGGCS